MSGLIYEVAWVRSLELIFGTTTFAVATVLAAFMGGLACGSYFMGRLSTACDRFHPLRIYAALECLIAVIALLIPPLLHWLVPVYQLVWKTTHASFFSFSLIRFALSGLVLFVPTFLMGATLPVVSGFVSRAGKDGDQRIGLLYTFNTLGAVLGCAAAGLVLFPSIGLARTQWVAVVLNLVSAAGGLALAAESVHNVGESSASARPAGTDDAPGLLTRTESNFLVTLYAASGFVAMLYEVAWSRVLVLVLGSSTYAYTIMLATFLLGLAVGAGLATRCRRVLTRPLFAAGLCQLAIALATYFSLFLVEEMPYFYLKGYETFHPSPRGLLSVQFLLAAGLMILPTLGLGAMFPITIHGLNSSGRKAARTVGWAYALNTVGAIGGSVLAGFWFVPQFGSQSTLLGGLAANTLLGLAALATVRTGRLARFRPGWVAGLLLLCAGAIYGTPRWDPAVMSSGVFRYVRDYLGLSRAAFRERARKVTGEVLLFDEGLTCTVTVFRNPDCLSLLVNGKPDASTPSGLTNPFDPNAPALLLDLPTQILLGQIPLLLAPQRDDALVIGLGSGLTLGAVLTHPVKHVQCVELEKAVVRGSRFFEDFNRQPLADPRLELVVNDARNHLLVTDRKYDVIISEPSNPWIPGAANLFTREFFEISRSKLRPQGVFCQWIQLYELQPAHFQTILRTFTSVFPEAHLFRVNSDAILVGSAPPLPIQESELESRLTPAVRSDLARIRIHDGAELLARYWVGGDELKRGLSAAPCNTDDNMFIEFVAPLQIMAGRARAGAPELSIAGLFDGRTSGALPHVLLSEPDQAADFWARVSEAALQQLMPETPIYSRHSLELRANARAAAVQGTVLLRQGQRSQARLLLETAARQFPNSPPLLRALAQVCALDENWTDARRYAESWVGQEPDNPLALFSLGRSLFYLQEPKASRAALERIAPAAGKAEELKDLPFYLGALHAKAGQYSAAAEHFNAFLRREPAHLEARVQMADALYRAGRPADAAVQWERIAQINALKARQSEREAEEDWQEGKREQAIGKLEQARRLDPSNTGLVLMLARARAGCGEVEAAAETLGQHLSSYPDRPAAVGYLSQLRARQQRTAEAQRLALRYRALTGKAWQELRD